MLLLLNEDTGMGGGSDDVECEGHERFGLWVMNLRAWKLMLRLMTLRRARSLVMSVGTVQALAKAWRSTMKLIRYCRSIN